MLSWNYNFPIKLRRQRVGKRKTGLFGTSSCIIPSFLSANAVQFPTVFVTGIGAKGDNIDKKLSMLNAKPLLRRLNHFRRNKLDTM